MSTTETQNASRDAAAGNVDMHLEVDIIPVSDVDRAKQFYQRLGWRLDSDVAPLDGLRIVQFTPPGSATSVNFEAAHAEHQKRTGRSHLFHRSVHDEGWPAWYAAYLAAEQAGTDLPA